MERKVHRGMKENIRKRKRKHPGRLADGTGTNYQVLECVPVREMSASDGGAVDEIPIVNAVNEKKLNSENSVDQFLKGSPKRKSKRVKDSVPKHKHSSTADADYAADGVEQLDSHGHTSNGVCSENQTNFTRKIRYQTQTKQSSNEVAYSKDNFEGSEKFGRKYYRGVKPQQSLLNFEEPSQKGGHVEEEQDEEGDETVMAFRAELADLPLSKVREVKERLGLKLFNKAYFGISEYEEKKEIRKAEFKKADERVGQHRPKEITSKKPVSVFRPVYKNMKTTKKKRDPRFDSRAGLYKERCFEDNYSFLNDLRKNEREVLVKEAGEHEKSGDLETAAKIREVIRRMDNREKTKADRKLKQKTYQELRQENIDRMMRGERPVFKTKAKVKMMNVEKKFDQLKKEGRLDKYMKRKAKKEARKEAVKELPFEEKYGYR